MFTLEIKNFGDYDPANVFRITLTNDALTTLTHEDLQAYPNLQTLIIENNANLHTIDLRGNTSLRYLCLGSCDRLIHINLDQTQINKIDLYDLVALQSVTLDNQHLLNLKALLSENITKQFLYIEDAILECFETRIKETEDATLQKALTQAYEGYMEDES